MGAYQALWLATRESSAAPGTIKFDRYIAINPPVDLHRGINQLDAFHNAPLAWPADQRQARVDNTVRKVGALAMRPPAANGPPPFNAIESRYIIGLSFRLILRDAIFSSQSRNNLGVLQTPLSKWQRQAAYDEISQFSYHDYVTRFVFPYYQKRGVNQSDFKSYSTLRHIGSALRHNPKVRLVTNRNDFLLAPGDIEWMRATLGDKRLKILPNGGHLGNLASPEVRDTLTDFLSDPPSSGGAR
jgi:pimeloyl-ACP methyl ester carboxylesterase